MEPEKGSPKGQNAVSSLYHVSVVRYVLSYYLSIDFITV